MIKNLPLIALVTLGLAACGDDDVEDIDDMDDVEVARTDDALVTERTDDGIAMDDMDDDMDTMGDDAMVGGTMDGMQEGVVVTVNGFEQEGTVYVALQEEGIFGTADATYGTSMDPAMMTGDSLEIVIPDVTPGEYAIAVFQDTNGNGQLDLGTNGIPTEPWALSNGAGTSGAPNFDDAAMEFDGEDDRADVTLNSMM